MSIKIYGKITVIKRNGSCGSQFPVTSSFCTFGRDADCEIRIQLPSVSDKECKLCADENGNFVLSKINKEGEVLVNDQLLRSDEIINHNDVLTIAGRSFRFEYPPRMKSAEDIAKQTKMIGTPKSQLLEKVKKSQVRRVSFGPQLSPEQFASSLPPNTPVKKGAIPMQILSSAAKRNRRSSVLRDANTPKDLKQKTPSPKIAKKESASKTGKKRSFDELVALVGLNAGPKPSKATPLNRRSIGKTATQSKVKDLENTSAINKKKTPKHYSGPITPTAMCAQQESSESAKNTPVSKKTSRRGVKAVALVDASTDDTQNSFLNDTIPVDSLPVTDVGVLGDKRRSRKLQPCDTPNPVTDVDASSKMKTPKSGEKQVTPKPSSNELSAIVADTAQKLPFLSKNTSAGMKITENTPFSANTHNLSQSNPDMFEDAELTFEKKMEDEMDDTIPVEASLTNDTLEKQPGEKIPPSHSENGGDTNPISGLEPQPVKGVNHVQATARLSITEKTTILHQDEHAMYAEEEMESSSLVTGPPVVPATASTQTVMDVKKDTCAESAKRTAKSKRTPKRRKSVGKTPKSTSKTTNSSKKMLKGEKVNSAKKVSDSQEQGPAYEEYEYELLDSEPVTIRLSGNKKISPTPGRGSETSSNSMKNDFNASYEELKIPEKRPTIGLRSDETQKTPKSRSSSNRKVENSPSSDNVVAGIHIDGNVLPEDGSPTLRHDLNSSYSELQIIGKKITQPKRAGNGLKTPKEGGKRMKSGEDDKLIEETNLDNPPQNKENLKMVLQEAATSRRRSITRKTPKSNNICSLKSSTKSARWKSLRQRKSGVLLWSEIVRKNAGKQSEAKPTALQQQHSKPLKKSRKPIPKTPQQMAALRHVDSPATIYIGRSERKRDDPCLDPIDFDVSEEYFTDENFAEDCSVVAAPDKESEDADTTLDLRTAHFLKTPKETNEPVEEHFGVERLFRTPKLKTKNEPVSANFGTKRLMKTPKEKVKGQQVEEHFGTKRLLKTPKEKRDSVDENFGTKRLLKTPKLKNQNEPVHSKFGIKRLMTTPKEKIKGEPVEEHFGTKRLLKTPKEKVKSQELEGDFGTKRLLATSKVKAQAVEDNFGIKRLLTTPKDRKFSPVNDHFGTKRLLKTPKDKLVNQPVDEDFGLESLFAVAEDDDDVVQQESPACHEVNKAPVRRSTRAKQETNKTMKTREKSKNVKNMESIQKRSTRKRKMPPTSSDDLGTMQKKKIKTDSEQSETLPKRSTRSKGNKRLGLKEVPVPLLTPSINNTKDKVDKTAVPTRRSTRSRKVQEVVPADEIQLSHRERKVTKVNKKLEVIAEQDETDESAADKEIPIMQTSQSKENISTVASKVEIVNLSHELETAVASTRSRSSTRSAKNQNEATQQKVTFADDGQNKVIIPATSKRLPRGMKSTTELDDSDHDKNQGRSLRTRKTSKESDTKETQMSDAETSKSEISQSTTTKRSTRGRKLSKEKVVGSGLLIESPNIPEVAAPERSSHPGKQSDNASDAVLCKSARKASAVEEVKSELLKRETRRTKNSTGRGGTDATVVESQPLRALRKRSAPNSAETVLQTLPKRMKRGPTEEAATTKQESNTSANVKPAPKKTTRKKSDKTKPPKAVPVRKSARVRRAATNNQK